MAGKIKSVSEVVATIPNGAHIALGGFAIARNVITIVHELIRQQKRELVVSQGVAGLDTDLLVGAGLVSRLIIGGGSLDRFGPVHCINRARETGSLALRGLDQPLALLPLSRGRAWALLHPDQIADRLGNPGTARARAGAGDVKPMQCPFTGETYIALSALTPDVSFVHVQIADADGNCRIDGPRWENEEQAKAAKRLIVVAEEIVPTEEIQRQPERTIIPGHRVEAVIHQPFGAHPTAVFGCYDYDAAHLKLYVEHSKRSERIGDYIDTYIQGPKDHREYLEKAGGLAHLCSLKADPVLGY